MKYKGFGLGCMGMRTASIQENTEVICAALDEGITFLNTGDFYGAGESETVLSEALREIPRDQYYISLKFGLLNTPNGRLRLDVHPSRVKRYLTDSLKRLKLDYVDLYQPCRIDLAIPVEETIGAIADLVQQGYVRHIGISEVDATTLEKANATHPIEYVEMDYSLFNREIERDIIPTARRLDITVVAFGLLAHGLLNGSWTREKLAGGDASSNMRVSLMAAENIEQNIKLIEQLQQIADEKHITLPQLAHAWILTKGADIVPLIGASKLKNFKDTIKARNIILSGEDIRKIEAAIPSEQIAGTSMSQFRFRNGILVEK